jgi:SWI/SNF-related matrix-associated actin-dependent regulator 1 of chromatin subfamily A
MDLLVNEDGTSKEDWYRVVNESGLIKTIKFMADNGHKFDFDNLDEAERIELRKKYKELLKKFEETLQLKAEGIETGDVDFSFMKIQPYEYQKQAVVFGESAGNFILGDEPGVGKTLVPVTYGAKHKLKTLVLCPASLKLNWRNEIHKFTHEKAFIFKYKPKKKSGEITNTKEESLFHIANYESLETYMKFNVGHRCVNGNCGWQEISKIKKHKFCPKCKARGTVKSRNDDLVFLEDKMGITLNPSDYGMIVCDEAHFLKEMKTHRTKLVKRAFAKTTKKILLTGTAIKNRPYEFFSLLNFIDPNEWKSAHNFGIKYCDGTETNFGWTYDGASNLPELFKRIQPFFLRRRKKDVLKFLPPKTYTNIPIELTDEEYREYKKIEKGVIDEASATDNEMTHLARIQKLRQFLSGIKLRHAEEIIRSVLESGQKIVVFSSFIKPSESIGKIFGKEAVVFNGQKNMDEKQKAVDDFQNDEAVSVFAGTIGAAGVGITLTAANIVLFIDLDYVPANMEQAEDRCHRASTTADNVQIIRLICQDTIDEDMDRLLTEKSAVSSQVLDGTENDKQVQKVEASIFKDIISLILKRKVIVEKR